MSKLVLTDANVVINSVDLSANVRQVTINYGASIHESHGMGSTSKRRLVGLKDFSVELEFHQDYAAAQVDATLFPLVGAAPFAIAIRPTSAVVSATNPEYQGNAVLESYPPIDGAIDEVLTAGASFQGDGDLTRAVV